MSKKMSKLEFFELLNNPDVQRSATVGKANWDAIYKALKETNEPLDIKTIQEEYVKDAVVRQRTLNVLKTWAAQDKCKQIWYRGRYWFYFGRKPRARRKKAAKKTTK